MPYKRKESVERNEFGGNKKSEIRFTRFEYGF